MWILIILIAFFLFVAFCYYRGRKELERQREEQERQEKIKEEQRLHEEIEIQCQQAQLEFIKLNLKSQLEQALRIVIDSSLIFTNTHSVQTVLGRIKDVKRYLPVVKDATPEELDDVGGVYGGYNNIKDVIDPVESLMSNEEELVNIVIKRSFEFEAGKAMELKTKNGRIERIKRHAAKIKEIDGLSPNSIKVVDDVLEAAINEMNRLWDVAQNG